MSMVIDHLERRGLRFEVIPHERTFTALAEASAVGVSADHVVKTVVADTGWGHVLLIIPASRRLDMDLVRAATGDEHVHLATEAELSEDFPLLELGAFPPIGSILGIPIYVDPEVLEHDVVVFAAGRQTESIRLRTGELFRGEPVMVARLTTNWELATEIC